MMNKNLSCKAQSKFFGVGQLETMQLKCDTNCCEHDTSCCEHHVTIPFCVNKWKLCIGNSSKYCDCDCLCIFREEKNPSILNQLTRNALCDSLNTVFTNISIHHSERLKKMNHFLFLVSVLMILFLFSSVILTIIGTLQNNMAFFVIGMCSLIVLLFISFLYYTLSYQYKKGLKSYHKLLLHHVKHHTIPQWHKKYPDLEFTFEFCEGSCCNSIDKKHGLIIIQKKFIKKFQKPHKCKKIRKYKPCLKKDTDCLLPPNVAHIKYNI